MRKQPKQKRSKETRRRIIETGLRLFTRDGYHATSSKKIARETGIAVGSFYNHFEDKKSLLLEIYSEHCENVHNMLIERLGGISTGGLADGGRALSQAIVQQTLALHDLSPDFHREISALALSDQDLRSLNRHEEEKVVGIITRLLKAQEEKLRVDDLEAAVWVVSLAVEAVVHSIKMSEPPIAVKRLKRALAEMITCFLFRNSL